jgi:MYXO-CTERM domain-containing protein
MRSTSILLAAALVAAPVPAIAQDTSNDIVYSDTERQDDSDDDGNSRLGLLGLLGLAGLLGLFRREPDIHVDARRDGRDDDREPPRG